MDEAQKSSNFERYTPSSERFRICILYISMALHPLWTWQLFEFLNPYTVDRTHWTGDQPVARPLPTHKTQTQNKRTQTFIPRVGFEPSIPVFERVKLVHASDHAAMWLAYMLYRITNSLEDSPFRDGNTLSSSQVVLCPLWNPNAH
jgi:hypothetical protein